MRQAYPERTLVRARVDTHVGVTATRVWYAWDVRSLIYLVRGGLWGGVKIMNPCLPTGASSGAS